MKITLRNAPKLLLVIPVLGLMGAGLQTTAHAEGHGRGGDAVNNGTPKDPDTAHNPHDMGGNSGKSSGNMGSSCDVPEPAWFTMVAAGGLPMGLGFIRRKFGKSR
ncbi:MAG: hypothetical protein M3Y56_05310 [Armatimonadota bacterium]|nr:hypothetical protein [Armatimonadota bacterium]